MLINTQILMRNNITAYNNILFLSACNFYAYKDHLLCLVFISYHLIHFHPSSPCLKFQVTSFGLQQLKGLGLSSTKSDLKHVFEEICCWTTRLCGQIALASKPPHLRVCSLLLFLLVCAVNTDNANGPQCFIRENMSGWQKNTALMKIKKEIVFLKSYMQG